MLYALVIFAFAGSDGGRAINTDLRFASLEMCQEAARAIAVTASAQRQWLAVTACVRVQ